MTATDAGQDPATRVSDEMLEAHARTVFALENTGPHMHAWDTCSESVRENYREEARLHLSAMVASGWRSEADVREVHESWKATYEAKVQEFAAETRRTSTLVKALHDAGHRAEDFVKNRYCGRCEALRQIGAIDPEPWGKTGR